MDLATATRVFVCSFTVLVLLSRPAMCCEPGEEGEFNYDPFSKEGPYHWGDIRTDWYLCKNGTRQSPINLPETGVNIAFNSGLRFQYQPSNATLLSTDHDVMIRWTGNAGSVLINGTQYVLRQCHWHSPSEHTINGIRYDLELHMVHNSSGGRIAVIGAVYRISRPDPFLSTIEDDLRLLAQNRSRGREVGIVDPMQIIGSTSNSSHFRYNGSLTTPPCCENVDWTVFREVKAVTREQIRLLRVAVRDEAYTNARPLQPRNNRMVQLYLPKDHKEIEV